MSADSLLPSFQKVTLLGSHMVENRETASKLSPVSSSEGTNLSISQRPHVLMLHSGARISAYEDEIRPQQVKRKLGKAFYSIHTLILPGL